MNFAIDFKSSGFKTTKDIIAININSANEQELNNLPSIGPKLAKRIIEYRFIHGSFESLDEIRAVKGLGAKKFSQIENYLTVQP